nr:hypothetical protein Iba_chr06fCG7400 [Ipomoea batatas]
MEYSSAFLSSPNLGSSFYLVMVVVERRRRLLILFVVGGWGLDSGSKLKIMYSLRRADHKKEAMKRLILSHLCLSSPHRLVNMCYSICNYFWRVEVWTERS